MLFLRVSFFYRVIINLSPIPPSPRPPLLCFIVVSPVSRSPAFFVAWVLLWRGCGCVYSFYMKACESESAGKFSSVCWDSSPVCWEGLPPRYTSLRHASSQPLHATPHRYTAAAAAARAAAAAAATPATTGAGEMYSN